MRTNNSILFSMKSRIRYFFIAVFTVLGVHGTANAQDNSLTFYGDVRVGHIGNDTNADGLGGNNSLLRIRPGIKYLFNENHSFSGRLAYLVSVEFEDFDVSLEADYNNRALSYGTLGIDELYYQYSDAKNLLKVGRFQQSFNVLSNAQRSHFKFQSNANFVHWTDGVQYRRYLNNGWFGEAIVEFHEANVSYPYSFGLDFDGDHLNVASFLNFEHRQRDENNIIQKGFTVMWAPHTYIQGSTANDFIRDDYLAISSRIAYDLPKPDALEGGSIRIAGEIGTNLHDRIENAYSMVASFGINNYADKHELMVELAKTGSQWLTASSYARNADELEIRYRYHFSPKFNMDFRYRIRDYRIDGVANRYSTFIRATYKF